MKAEELYKKSEKIIFEDKLIIQKALIGVKNNNIEFDRVRVKRPDAVAVFLYNVEIRKVVLTKQFRYAISDKVNAPVLEILAGKIDGADSPENTAVREAEEETGYRIKKENLVKLAECFVSPGYTSEKFYLYFTEITNADKTPGGGGLEAENEYIEVIETDSIEFFKMLDAGKIEDGKTLTASLLVRHKGLIKS